MRVRAGAAHTGSRLELSVRACYDPSIMQHHDDLTFLRRRRALGVAVLAAALFVSGCRTTYEWTSYPDPKQLESLTAAEWREDVAYLREELPRRNPHLRQDEALGDRFEAEARQLETAIGPDTTCDEVIAGVARLLAVPGEGHTAINASPRLLYPVFSRWFADGLYVVSADRRYAEAVGTRVVGARQPDGTLIATAELEAVLNAVISVDHPNGYRLSHGQTLTNPRLMRGLGLADRDGLRLVLESDGTEFDLTIDEVARAEIDLLRLSDGRDRQPLAATRPYGNWWVRTGASGEIVYVSYDRCEMEGFRFFRQVLREVRDERTMQLIVDLRENSGGLSVPGTWFARRLRRLDVAASPETVAVLIGPRTFSSGMMLAVDLMHYTDARFAGEPLAESARSWGEVKRFPLPNSGLLIGHSTRLVDWSRGKDLRVDGDGNIVPDPGYHIVPSFADYTGGVDPVVEAVLGG